MSDINQHASGFFDSVDEHKLTRYRFRHAGFLWISTLCLRLRIVVGQSDSNMCNLDVMLVFGESGIGRNSLSSCEVSLNAAVPYVEHLVEVVSVQL